MSAYRDLGDLPEDDRIAIIAREASSGKTVGFFVDDDAKADRYVAKLATFAVRVIDRRRVGAGPTVLVRVGPVPN